MGKISREFLSTHLPGGVQPSCLVLERVGRKAGISAIRMSTFPCPLYFQFSPCPETFFLFYPLKGTKSSHLTRFEGSRMPSMWHGGGENGDRTLSQIFAHSSYFWSHFHLQLAEVSGATNSWASPGLCRIHGLLPGRSHCRLRIWLSWSCWFSYHLFTAFSVLQENSQKS